MTSLSGLRICAAARLLALASVCIAGSGLVQTAYADTKIAFIGDQGTALDARRVLELVREEGTELLLIQGDLGYFENAAKDWIANIDGILGKDFPVLIVVGNHENFEWQIYKQWQKDKLARVPAIQCEGDVGVKSYCKYKDFGVVQVSPGIIEVAGVKGEDNYPEYITEKLEADNSTWRFCAWHKNMRDMQTGAKSDATGWGVYQNCLAQGGIAVAGHEHAYSRTHLMSDFENKKVIHTSSDLQIGPNSSIAIVSGLGGHQVRAQRHGGDWFASIYTSDQGATDGALFCSFAGIKADCYMKDVAGRIPDTFTMTSLRGKNAVEEQEAADQARREAEWVAEQDRLAAAEATRVAEEERLAAEQAQREAEAAWVTEQERIQAEEQAQAAWVAEQEQIQAQAEADWVAEQAQIQAQAEADWVAEQAQIQADSGTQAQAGAASVAEQVQLQAQADEANQGEDQAQPQAEADVPADQNEPTSEPEVQADATSQTSPDNAEPPVPTGAGSQGLTNTSPVLPGQFGEDKPVNPFDPVPTSLAGNGLVQSDAATTGESDVSQTQINQGSLAWPGLLVLAGVWFRARRQMRRSVAN